VTGLPNTATALTLHCDSTLKIKSSAGSRKRHSAFVYVFYCTDEQLRVAVCAGRLLSMSVASFRQLLPLLCRKARSGSVIKELEQMCENARSIRRRAASATAAAAVPSVQAPSARRFSFRAVATAANVAVRRRRLISLK